MNNRSNEFLEEIKSFNVGFCKLLVLIISFVLIAVAL